MSFELSLFLKSWILQIDHITEDENETREQQRDLSYSDIRANSSTRTIMKPLVLNLSSLNLARRPTNLAKKVGKDK